MKVKSLVGFPTENVRQKQKDASVAVCLETARINIVHLLVIHQQGVRRGFFWTAEAQGESNCNGGCESSYPDPKDKTRLLNSSLL